MIKINRAATGINLILFFLSNILILMKVLNRKDFDFGANALVVLCLAASIYTQLNPGKVKWFGDSLDSDHGANIIVSRIFALIFLIPAFFMNLNPYVRLLK